MEKPRMLKRIDTVSKAITPIYNGAESVSSDISYLTAELMASRTSFHLLHLKVTGAGSFAAHLALNELYDALPGLVDTIVEGFQGVEETILECSPVEPKVLEDVEDAINYLRMLYKKVTLVQSKVPYSEIVNNMDLIKDAISKAKYKLLFLK